MVGLKLNHVSKRDHRKKDFKFLYHLTGELIENANIFLFQRIQHAKPAFIKNAYNLLTQSDPDWIPLQQLVTPVTWRHCHMETLSALVDLCWGWGWGFYGDRWILLTKVEISFFFVVCLNKLLNKRSNYLWFETPQCWGDVTVMKLYHYLSLFYAVCLSACLSLCVSVCLSVLSTPKNERRMHFNMNRYFVA